MNMNQQATFENELKAIQEQFERWRQQNQNKRKRISEPLWEQAAHLARQRTVHKVARTLRLDYNILKKRAGGKTALTFPRTNSARFVEMSLPAVTMNCGGTLIEMTNRKGARMAIRCPHLPPCDLMDLSRVFLK
jgi:hypothetical protein